MRIGLIGGAALWALIIYASGCASTEIYSKVGWRRVDEQQESQRTYRQDTKPLKCLFVNCDEEVERGS